MGDKKPNPSKNCHKYPLWTARLNDEMNLCTADLTEDESDYNDSLDPVAHLIRHLPPDDHNSNTVTVYICTVIEEEDVDYILDDPIGDFDYYQPHKT